VDGVVELVVTPPPPVPPELEPVIELTVEIMSDQTLAPMSITEPMSWGEKRMAAR
jgi:hypothetical protein